MADVVKMWRVEEQGVFPHKQPGPWYELKHKALSEAKRTQKKWTEEFANYSPSLSYEWGGEPPKAVVKWRLFTKLSGYHSEGEAAID